MKFLIDNKILFQSERKILNDDLFFTENVCVKANKITFIRDCLYVRYENLKSLTQTYKSDRFEKASEFMHIQFELINSNYNIEEAMTRALDTCITNLICSTKQEVLNKNIKFSDKLAHIKKMGESNAICRLKNDYPVTELPFDKRLFMNCYFKKMYIFVYLFGKLNSILTK